MAVFSHIPEWVCLVLTLLFVQLSHEVGYKVGNTRRLRPGANPETSAAAMSTTTIGLLAFMLAFTFNGASADYDTRKDLVMEEANAVRTAYLRSTMLPEPEKAQTHELLREYVDIRVKAVQNKGATIAQVVKRSGEIHAVLWSNAVAMEKKAVSEAGNFADAVAGIIEVHARRANAVLTNRISPYIWSTLYLLTFLTMAMLGYRTGLTGVRSHFIEICLALAFSAVLILIIALDHRVGIMQISQQPMADVLNFMRSGLNT